MGEKRSSPTERTGPSRRATEGYAHLSPSELLQAVASSSVPAAWEEFVRRFHPVLAGVALTACRRFGLSSREAAEELTQDIYLKLCAKGGEALLRFRPSYPNSAYAYLRVVATHHAIDILRSRLREKRGGGVEALSVADERAFGGDGGAAASRAERHVLLRQIDEVFVRAPSSSRDRRIFWLYYRTGLEASAIARLPDIELGVKGVESVLFRLTSLVRDALGRRTMAKGNAVRKASGKVGEQD
jgi:RNA polymerase sigma-70 factor (ECF subfamily)